MNKYSKNVFRIASPVFISLLAQNIIGLTDTAFMGRLGEIALGGSAMASMVYFCVFTLGFGLGAGTQIIIARRFGSKHYSNIGKVLSQSFIMLSMAAVFVIVVGYFFGEKFFYAVFSSDRIAAVATEYWDYRLLGFLFSFLCAAFRSFFVGIARTKVLTYNAFVMAFVNIILDYGLIFGQLGLPQLGVKGAAIASVIAEMCSLVFYLVYVRLEVDRSHFGLSVRGLFSIQWKLILKIFRLSVYIMLQALISMSSWALFFFMIEHLGERPLAIATIIRSVYIFLFIPINSFSTSVNSLVSQLIGAGKSDEVKRFVRSISRLSFLVMAGVCIIISVFPGFVIGVFTDEPVLIQEARPALYVICVSLCICAYGNMAFSAVSAAGATKKALLIEMAATIFYVIYSGIMTYGLRASVDICYTVEVLYYIFIGIFSYKYLWSGKWKSKKL
ncbi:MATE family efflux transporter [Falsiporphyromonas endometrii]|uniref:Multidrug-efflux transporter n=1 Tax=Falsiporphyromonas endometrii TaxID=1387297 RepID=A0ABV9KAC9_9PORP|nr:MATE family efflux transporter [Porphyromonadaceae bacterium]